MAVMWIKKISFCPSYLQTPLSPCPCWSSTSSWVWWQVALCSAGAAGHLAGSCGVSASVASYPAATRPAPRASSAPAAAPTARSTDWLKSPHTHLSTGPQRTRWPQPTALMKMLQWRLFRAEGLLSGSVLAYRDMGTACLCWAVIKNLLFSKGWTDVVQYVRLTWAELNSFVVCVL